MVYLGFKVLPVGCSVYKGYFQNFLTALQGRAFCTSLPVRSDSVIFIPSAFKVQRLQMFHEKSHGSAELSSKSLQQTRYRKNKVLFRVFFLKNLQVLLVYIIHNAVWVFNSIFKMHLAPFSPSPTFSCLIFFLPSQLTLDISLPSHNKQKAHLQHCLIIFQPFNI